jgi:hypothetical protein
MRSLRESIARASSRVAERQAAAEAPPKYDYSFLHALKKELDKYFKEEPEATVARIRKQFAFDVCDRPKTTYVRGKGVVTSRQYVSDWLAENGFSDEDAKEMRRRIDQHAAAEAQ